MREQKFRYQNNLCIPSAPPEYFQVTLCSSLNTSTFTSTFIKNINKQDNLITDLLHHFA